jgi:kinetochore protein Mis13/DSN1
VSDASFYKHIDSELPETLRLQQLLIWCTSRCPIGATQTSAKKKTQSKRTTDASQLPPLSAVGVRVLESVKEDLIRKLAEKKIDTSLYNASTASTAAAPRAENAQNVKNRARKVKFTEQIERYVALIHGRNAVYLTTP